jgi:hypothetical protein
MGSSPLDRLSTNHLFTASPALSIATIRATSSRPVISVKVASIGDVSIGDYTKDTDIDNPEILTDADQTLVIDQQKYFNFYIDSVDRAQQNVNVLDEAMRRAAYKLNDTADSYIALLMEAAITAGNTIGSFAVPKIPTKDDAYEYLGDPGTLLDENNTPISGRFCIVPA